MSSVICQNFLGLIFSTHQPTNSVCPFKVQAHHSHPLILLLSFLGQMALSIYSSLQSHVPLYFEKRTRIGGEMWKRMEEEGSAYKAGLGRDLNFPCMLQLFWRLYTLTAKEQHIFPQRWKHLSPTNHRLFVCMFRPHFQSYLKQDLFSSKLLMYCGIRTKKV